MNPVPAEAGPDWLRRVATDSAIGSLWTTVSRVSGLLRVVVVAAVLGPTHFADLYAATNQLPSLAFELLTGALLVSLVVPALVRSLDGGRPGAAERVAGGFLGLALLAALSVVAVPVLAGPLVLDLLTAGVPRDAAAPGTGAAWLLLALLMVQVPLYLVAGTAAAVQNAHGRFAVAAGAPIAENVGIVLVLLAYAAAFGGGDDGTQGLREVVLLGGGTTAAVLLHAAVQWEGARRCGVRLLPRRGGRRDPEVQEMLRLVRPSLGYAAATTVRYLCVLVVAGAVPGGVVAFITAYAFYNVPVALVARPVAQAALPVLSRAHLAGDTAGFGETFRRTASLVLLITVPAAIGCVLLSGPLATAVAFGEMSADQGRAALQACLLGLGAGIVGESAVVLGTQAAYARRDAVHPLLAVVLRAVLAVTGMLTAWAVLDGPALLAAAALSIAVSDLVAGALLWWWVGRPGGRPGRGSGSGSWRGTLARPAVAGCALVPAMLLVTGLVPPPQDQLGALGLVAATSAVGLAVHLLVLRVLRTPELGRLTRAWGARRG